MSDSAGEVKNKVYDFANSYITYSDTPCTSPELEAWTCPSAPALKAEQHCSKLEESVFSACHSVINWKPFKTLCMNDVCAASAATPDQVIDVTCAMLSRYSRQCSLNNIVLKWRGNVPEWCRK